MRLLIIAAVCLMMATVPAFANAGGNNWMKTLSGNLSLSELSIPGTHDSGALYEPIPGTAKCQTMTIDEQLNAGVRFLDIRCRHLDNAFVIHHGVVYQRANFDNVIDTAARFLKANPSECVIMSIKEEYDASGNTRSFEDTFRAYVAKNPSLWYLGSSIPTLSAARGKIVLFRRFNAGQTPLGIDASVWPDNAMFTNASLRVQDDYQVADANVKWNNISQMLAEAQLGPSGILYLNFTSGVKTGVFGIPDITYVSNAIVPKLAGFFASNRHGRYGIVIMDFVDSKQCSMVYGTNGVP
jgi:1-phosphatidylinositol phosphodiesterase